MPQNPFESPGAIERSEGQAVRLLGWWIAISYLMPLLILITFTNEAGWYGTGTSGVLQGWLRIVAFVTGIGCAYYVLIRGTMKQKFAVAPAALGYTALGFGIVWDNYL